MTSLDLHYPSIGPLGPTADSVLRDGVALLGFRADAQLVLSDTGSIGTLLAADLEGSPAPLGAFLVASDLVEAAGTRIYSLGGGVIDSVRQNLEFFEAWQFGRVTTLDHGVLGKTLSFSRTGTDARLRNETLLIGWEADYDPSPSLSAPPTLADAAPVAQSKAFVAFTELRQWLNMSVDEAARLIGVSRTTPVTSWQGKGHEPQARKARRLYQLHAAMGSLIDQFGEQGTNLWLNAGPVPPISLMHEADLTAFTDAVERMAIRRRKRVGPVPGSDVAPREDVMPVAAGGRRRPVTVHKRG